MSNNRRIVIYALGQVFDAAKDSVEWEQVAAVSDRKKQAKVRLHGKPYRKPDEIKDIAYDNVAVFSNRFFEDVRLFLSLQMGVAQERIVSWRAFTGDFRYNLYRLLHDIREYINRNQINRVLLSGLICREDQAFISEDIDETGNVIFDALNCSLPGRISFCIRNAYKDAEMLNRRRYPLIVHFVQPDLDYEMLATLLKMVKQPGGRLLLIDGYQNDYFSRAGMIEKSLPEHCAIRYLYRNSGVMTEITPPDAKKEGALSIYVVKHKRYHELTEHPYRTIRVGGYREDGRESLSDDTGDNIAKLNDKINECTALYWLWKHAKDKMIGINHYRRYFANSDMPDKNNFLQADRARMLLSTHDVILAERTIFDISLREQLENTMDKEAFRKAEALVTKSIRRHQPDYLDTFRSVMEGYAMFPANMMVAPKRIFDAYCEWLFSIILEPAEKFDATPYDAYSARAVGFFAERLLTVWIVRQKLKIKELPVICENEG